ncbi:unnamed protein product [Effrenium voratum]|uniref:Uncharacterized protein n=1 Tax=Effrenium voratum TaxID=2562239 RepID=A0AA36NKC3_9DINO|nr:unnamed protein product [Effrenium voratum]
MICPQEAEDWLPVPLPDGSTIAKVEEQWSWRDEGRTVLLYVRVPGLRGERLKALNQNGLVMVDIRPNLLRLIVTDTSERVTHRFQWLNLWGLIQPGQSRYHLSEDGKRVVAHLRKVNDNFTAGSWLSFLDVRTGRYELRSAVWPKILWELQGAWRSEDEEPIEVLGDQVVWPQGSRDVLLVEEDDSFLLHQVGDGDKVPGSECRGFFQRETLRICWEDGDSWCRICGLALERKEAGREALPLQYDQQLARWIPWLPCEDLRRQSRQWLPALGTEVPLEVRLQAGAEVALCAEEALRSLKEQLLKALEEAPNEGVQTILSDADALPMDLLRRCRVCAMSAEEAGLDGREGRLVEALLALRRGEPLSAPNEAAALGALLRWLQWLRCWLAPGARKNVEAAIDHLKERRLQASKERQHTEALHFASREPQRWFVAWSCELADASDLLSAASKKLHELLRHLARTQQEREGEGLPGEDFYTLFAQARRKVGEELVDIELPATRRRCDALARRWVRRYAEEAARTLFTGPGAKAFRRDFREGGLAIVEDAVDWAILVKLQAEVARLFEESPVTSRSARWLELCSSHLEESGCQALATSVAVLHQLPFSFSDSCWNEKAKTQVSGFKQRRWTAGEVVLWQSQPGTATSEVPESLPKLQDKSGITALLFLNTPAWRPDWGGALRCHVGPISRDIWGDGGRLVLLHEVSFELLESSRPQTVLILQLQPMETFSSSRPAPVMKREPVAKATPAQAEPTKVEMTSHEARLSRPKWR